MGRKLVIIVTVLGLVSLAACSPAPRPNIVWIVVDTLRADHTGFLGYPTPTTPHLDALSEESLVFTQAISQAPWTKPSVATMFTSTYPHQHAALKGGKRGDVLRDELLTIAEVLRERGYATVGFQLNPQVNSKMSFNQGLDVYKDDMRYGSRAEVVNSEITRWLRLLERNKYFLYIQYMDVHLPYLRHEQYADLYGPHETELSKMSTETIRKMNLSEIDRRYLENLYDGEIRYVDEQIGKLLQEFDDNTMIIITSDHGEEFWDHGGFEHGHSVYDELIRVPLIIKIPGYPHQQVNSQVRLMDIAPTILDVLGMSIPGEFRGQTLLDTLRNHQDRESFTEATYRGQERKAYRTSKEKIIFNVGDKTYEVYDIETDPFERENIEGREELKRRIQEFVAKKAQASEKKEIDEDMAKQLKSLGYVQ